MDAKYAGKSIVLPKDITAKLQARREKAAIELGFTPSLSETVAYVLKRLDEFEARERVTVNADVDNGE